VVDRAQTVASEPATPSGDDGLLEVLRDVVTTLEARGVAYVVMGGVGSTALGRPRGTHDIDLFVRPDSASAVLEALDVAGFATEETDPRWLYKAYKGGVLVDVIFRSTGDIYLDDEMLRRARVVDFGGWFAKVIAPEDLVVIKALAADEHVPQHWHDALGIIAGSELDWEYLTFRARRHGVRRVLSLLIYAQSNDLGVPGTPVRTLFEAVYDA
jgi:predicted nucleotidyltransferase